MERSKNIKIRILLAIALLLFSFPSVKALASETNATAGITCYNLIDNSVISGYGYTVPIYESTSGSGYIYSFEFDIDSVSGFSYSGYSLHDYDNLSWSPSFSGSVLTFSFSSETTYSFDGGLQLLVDIYFVPEPENPTPTPTPTRGPTNSPTPTPWIDKTYGQSGGADTVHAYLRAFNGSYRFGSDDWFQPSSTSLKIQIQAPGVSGRFTGDIPLPFPYKLDSSKFPVNAQIAAEGYPNSGWVGTFSVGSEDGTVLHCDGIGWPVQWSGGRNMYIATITMTPSPTLSPTPTLTPYPSSAPATFSTYTINFVAPNGYIVGTVRPVLSIGSSYSGAISALTFSFLDGWFSYGDEVDGEKGSFTWEYSYSENFGEYLWHFSTTSWPASESINIPVYRLDGQYPEVVPDLNNVSDLFDTIGKTDPQNFSWFYDGLQAFIDINWNWAYLMLLFPLFVMLWAFFRRH